MASFQPFRHRPLSENAWVVTESYEGVLSVSIGVVVGLEQIAVINAGPALGPGLRKYIESFAGVGKPFQCYCTAGKSEFIGGAWQFDVAFLPEADAELPQVDWAARLPASLAAEADALRPTPYGGRLSPLRPGFNAIGRQHLSPRPLPGNTPGSFVIINGEEKLCFMGDAVEAELTRLPYLDAAGFLRYAQELRKLTKERGGVLRFCCARSEELLSRDYILAVAAACEEIGMGQTQADKPGENGLSIHRIPGAAVAYDPKKL